MNMQATKEIRELSSEELGAVSGGWFSYCGGIGVIAARLARAIADQQVGSGGQGGQGGQSDPAQVFQQMMPN